MKIAIVLGGALGVYLAVPSNEGTGNLNRWMSAAGAAAILWWVL